MPDNSSNTNVTTTSGVQSYQINTNLEDYQLTEEDSLQITANSKLNQIFTRLIENDLYIYGNYEQTPKFWFCSWYNDDTIPGYKRGDFVWHNTADTDSFILKNAKQIRNIANANPFVVEKLPEISDTSNEEIVQQYRDVLSGYSKNTNLAFPLPPIYDIGNISRPAQLYVSLVDNNKQPVTDSTAWKQFLVINTTETAERSEKAIDKIENTLTNQASNLVNVDHIKNYHFGGNMNFVSSESDIEKIRNRYLSENFDNIEYAFPKNFATSNIQSRHVSGFDVVDVYVKKPLNETECIWFRRWKSGFLEHGGIIKTNSEKTVIQFDWEFIDENHCAYDVKYLLENTVTENALTDNTGDFLSVLVQLDKENFKIYDSTKAPVFFDKDSIQVTITPLDEKFQIGQNDIYSKIVNYSTLNNTVTDITNSRISITANSSTNTTPEYISYYATGYSI